MSTIVAVRDIAKKNRFERNEIKVRSLEVFPMPQKITPRFSTLLMNEVWEFKKQIQPFIKFFSTFLKLW